jgi:hypothetical protein
MQLLPVHLDQDLQVGLGCMQQRSAPTSEQTRWPAHAPRPQASTAPEQHRHLGHTGPAQSGSMSDSPASWSAGSSPARNGASMAIGQLRRGVNCGAAVGARAARAARDGVISSYYMLIAPAAYARLPRDARALLTGLHELFTNTAPLWSCLRCGHGGQMPLTRPAALSATTRLPVHGQAFKFAAREGSGWGRSVEIGARSFRGYCCNHRRPRAMNDEQTSC